MKRFCGRDGENRIMHGNEIEGMIQVTVGSPGERFLVAEELARWSTFWKSGKPNRCRNAFFDASRRIGAVGPHPAGVD